MRVLLIALAVLTGGQTPPNYYTELEARLVKAEALWAAKKPAAYQFSLRVVCFCPEVVNPQAFRVTGGVSVPVTPLSDVPRRRLYDHYDSVEKLFKVIRQNLATAPFKISAQFDPALGYPISFDVDGKATIADDELSLAVSDFKPLKIER